MTKNSKKAAPKNEQEERVVQEAASQENPPEPTPMEGVFLAPEDMEKVNKALAEREEYLALAQRVTADFDNYRKRTGAARSEGYDEGVRDAIAAILPTLDNFDRAMEAMKGADEGMLKGVELVRRGLFEAMEKLGMEEVSALGEPFDPELHEAVMRSPAEEGQADGQIVEVFKKGYRARGKIIRYAMVRVAHE